MATGERKNKSIFNGFWLGDYNKPDFENFPCTIPCLLKKGKRREVERINFFTSLKRRPSEPFVPTVFGDFAPIILKTKNAVNLPHITTKKGIVDAWKKKNPKKTLLDAVSQVKTTPIKP